MLSVADAGPLSHKNSFITPKLLISKAALLKCSICWKAASVNFEYTEIGGGGRREEGVGGISVWVAGRVRVRGGMRGRH